MDKTLKYIMIALVSLPFFGSSPVMADGYAGVNIASYHLDAKRDFNQINFGCLIGVRLGERLQYGAEIGFYNNSYSEITRYGLVFADYPVGPVRLGVWAGAFEYPNLIPWATRIGLPHSGDFIALAGVQAVIEFQTLDITLRALPGGNKSDVIFTLSASVPFGR